MDFLEFSSCRWEDCDAMNSVLRGDSDGMNSVLLSSLPEGEGDYNPNTSLIPYSPAGFPARNLAADNAPWA